MPPKDPSFTWSTIPTKSIPTRTGTRPVFTPGKGWHDVPAGVHTIETGGKKSSRYSRTFDAPNHPPKTQGMNRKQHAKTTAGKKAAQAAQAAKDAELGWLGRTMKTAGPYLGKAMNLWFAWDMARAAGYMGGEQSRGRDFMSAMGALQPEWRASVETAGRMQSMRNQVGGMEDLARFAKHKGFTTEATMQSMERELDQLIGNKAAVLSQASLLPPTTQAMVAGAVQTGAL